MVLSVVATTCPSVPSTISELSSPNTLPDTSPSILITCVEPGTKLPEASSLAGTNFVPSHFNVCPDTGVLDIKSTSCSELIDLFDSTVGSPGWNSLALLFHTRLCPAVGATLVISTSDKASILKLELATSTAIPPTVAPSPTNSFLVSVVYINSPSAGTGNPTPSSVSLCASVPLLNRNAILS